MPLRGAPRLGSEPASPPATPAPLPPTSGDELLRRVVDAYASITSYQDTGDVLTNWADKRQPDELHFKLLVDALRQPPPRPLEGRILLPAGVFEGVPCYIVKGHLDGKRDYLIRKIVETPPPGFLDAK